MTMIPKRQQTDILGRKKSLFLLNEELSKNNIVAITGIGGVGKTTFAQVYVDVFYESFEYILWLNQSKESVVTIFSTNIELIQNLKIKIQEIRNKAKILYDELNDEKYLFQPFMFREVLRRLKNITLMPNLLIIDDTNSSIEEYLQILPSKPKWQIILTSREKIGDIRNFNLDVLSPDDAQELFFKYCTIIEDKKAIKTLLQKIEYHTLLIEVLAKTAQKRNLSIDNLKSFIDNNLKANIKTAHSNYQKIEKITTYLLSIFSFEKINIEEKNALVLMACLPSRFYAREKIKDLMGTESSEKQSLTIESLEELSEKGWIQRIKIDKSISYKVHPIIADVVFIKFKIGVGDIVPLIKSISQKLKIDHTVDDPVTSFEYLDIGERIVSKFKLVDSVELAKLYKHVGSVYHDLSRYNEAIEMFRRLINFHKGRKNNPTDPEISDDYNHLISVLLEFSKFAESKELLEEVSKFNETNLDKYHEFAISSYSHFGRYYQLTDQLEEAEKYYKKALLADINVKGKSHPTTRLRYSNYALLLDDLGRREEAKEIQESLLQDLIKIHGESHHNTLLGKSNYATTIANLGEYDRALEILKEVVLCCEERENYETETALQYGNLAYVFQLTGNLENAKSYLEKSINIREAYDDDKHLFLLADYLRMGQVLNKLELWREAEFFITKVIKNIKEMFGQIHSYLIICYNEMGLLKLGLDIKGEAQEFFERSIELAKKMKKDDYLASSYISLSSFYESEDELEKAIELVEKAINLYLKVYQCNHPKIKKAKQKLEYLRNKKT